MMKNNQNNNERAGDVEAELQEMEKKVEMMNAYLE